MKNNKSIKREKTNVKSQVNNNKAKDKSQEKDYIKYKYDILKDKDVLVVKVVDDPELPMTLVKSPELINFFPNSIKRNHKEYMEVFNSVLDLIDETVNKLSSYRGYLRIVINQKDKRFVLELEKLKKEIDIDFRKVINEIIK